LESPCVVAYLSVVAVAGVGAAAGGLQRGKGCARGGRWWLRCGCARVGVEVGGVVPAGGRCGGGCPVVAGVVGVWGES